jgi:DNA-directed RNA polymerase subunit RPC12/RpoP
MDKKLVVLAEYRDLPQAGLAQSTLEAQGIPCFLDNQYVVGVKWVLSKAVGGIKLKVRARDASLANEILCGFELGYTKGLDEERLPLKATCPLCGSLKIMAKKYTPKFAVISHWFSLPNFFFLERNRCTECGHKWK